MTEHHLVCLSLKGGCAGSSESTLVIMSHCWKPHVTAHFRTVRAKLSSLSIIFSYGQVKFSLD